MSNVQIKDLITVIPTGADLVPISQDGKTRSATVENIRDKDLRTEVENARNGEANLDTRLDKFDTSLSDVANLNYIINGNFDVWQRGVSATNPITNNYLSDRFMIIDGITGTKPTNITHSKQIADTGLLGSNSFYRINSDSLGVLNSNDLYRIIQVIENGTRKLCGLNKKVTISFKAKSSIANKKIGVYLKQNYGSGGTPSNGENINGNFFTLTNTWQKYSITINTNDTNGKTFGSNNDDNLQLMFVIAYGSAMVSMVSDTIGETLGIGNIDIAQIKLESGDKATPFVPRFYAEELLLCKRYYQSFANNAVRSSAIVVDSDNIFSTTFALPVEMRTIPNINLSTIVVCLSYTVQTGFVVYITNSNTKSITFKAVKTVHGLTGNSIQFLNNDILTVDAEIY